MTSTSIELCYNVSLYCDSSSNLDALIRRTSLSTMSKTTFFRKISKIWVRGAIPIKIDWIGLWMWYINLISS